MNSSSPHGQRRSLIAITAPVALAAGVMSTMAPAFAADPAPTTYTYAASSYGTAASADQVGLRSAPTASSGIGCTKRAPVTETNGASSTDAGPQAQAEGVRTRNYTFTTAAGLAGVRSLSEIDTATIGNGRLGLAISNLRGYSSTFATKTGDLKAGSTFSFSAIRATGSDAGLLPSDLQDLLNGPVNEVVDQLRAGQPIEVPGLGVLKLGDVQDRVTSTYARADSTGLQVDLYGTDGRRGGGDDSVLTLGRTLARTSNASPDGLLGGQAYGLDATGADGRSLIGPEVRKSLPCEGTDGEILTNAVSELSPPSLEDLALGGLQNRVYGEQVDGGVTGWVENRVATFDLGSLHIEGIVARSSVTKGADGILERHVIRRIGSITADGTRYTAPAPGRSLVIPGIARIETPKSVSTVDGVRVTGLRITLLSGAQAQSVVNLAVTRAEVPE